MTKTKVYSKALEKTIEVDRIIGKITGYTTGPSLVMIGGMHGNEPSGVFALHYVCKKIKDENIPVKGKFYALSGNMWALEKGHRFDKEDLNRLWFSDQLEELKKVDHFRNNDHAQQIELYEIIENIISKDKGPFYFMDLHSTSSETIPFVVMNDSLLNRKYTSQYPVPVILGIEEYLDGPLLSYINELGYVAFGFEAGQHDDMSAIENHVAFIMVSLVFTGMVEKEDIDFYHYYNTLAKNSFSIFNFYEIFYRYKISEGENFVMEPGYMNFQHVKKGEKLASTNGNTIHAEKNARIFMPLYQSQGSEGFFAIREIPGFFLSLSSIVRNLRLNKLLTLLPGVSWLDKDKETLKVNRRIARFFTRDFFHLMGYRQKILNSNYYVMSNREAASRRQEYETEPWLN